ncbi:BglG family transcription antiterminator [Thermoflavimicrobium daqui]|uniref:Uncharacterized protein n=1 Tax=Thermoflavimicrobium daqui TaxID=2137476 RepID=A0A364K7Z5_9BACL|nr:PRD domain-containing protein [Thermoflavimicrobium daqui]RAL26414.1 hypothetical protein DL897_05330 [Thermoflavimicrobium daqui]
MVALTTRQHEILKYLFLHAGFSTTEELALQFQVSRRTIRYDLNYIEAFLKELEISLERKPKMGIRLFLNEYQRKLLEQTLQQTDFYMLPNFKLYLVIGLQLLLDNSTTLERLADLFKISKSKAFSLLEEVEKQFQEHGVQIQKEPFKGIFLIGHELDIRYLFQALYEHAIQIDLTKRFLETQWLSQDMESRIDHFIHDLERIFHVHYSERAKEELKAIIFFQIRRIHLHQEVTYSFQERQEVKRMPVYQEVAAAFNRNFQLPISDHEMAYILHQLKGSKVASVPLEKDGYYRDMESDALAQRIIEKAENMLGLSFQDDIELLHNLSVHLQVALYRIRQGLQIENPLTEQVKYKYRFIYETARKILMPMESELGLQFPEEEIAFIAMYLGGAFERQSWNQKGLLPTAYVVCGSGLATSSLLITRLKLLLPELTVKGPIDMDHAKTLTSDKANFIISTVPVDNQWIPVVKVHPLLEDQDIQQIRQLIFREANQKQWGRLKELNENLHSIRLGDFFSSTHIQLQKEVNDWRKAITFASQPLLNESYITTEYVKAMIQAVEELGTYMVLIPKVAFIHSSPKKGVKKDGFSLLTLKDPIFFGDQKKCEVQIIVVVSLTGKESDLFIQLFSIFEQPKTVEALLKAERIETVLNITQN